MSLILYIAFLSSGPSIFVSEDVNRACRYEGQAVWVLRVNYKNCTSKLSDDNFIACLEQKEWTISKEKCASKGNFTTMKDGE